MNLIRIDDRILNIDHIITIEDDVDDNNKCVIRMSNGDKFYIDFSKETVLADLQVTFS